MKEKNKVKAKKIKINTTFNYWFFYTMFYFSIDIEPLELLLSFGNTSKNWKYKIPSKIKGVLKCKTKIAISNWYKWRFNYGKYKVQMVIIIRIVHWFKALGGLGLGLDQEVAQMKIGGWQLQSSLKHDVAELMRLKLLLKTPNNNCRTQRRQQIEIC